MEQHLGFESSTDSFAGPKSGREGHSLIHFTFVTQNYSATFRITLHLKKSEQKLYNIFLLPSVLGNEGKILLYIKFLKITKNVET